MRLAVKMLIIALIALIGLAFPTYFYVADSLDLQHATERELVGIEPAHEATLLMKLMAEHRGLSARYLGGDSALLATLSAKNSEVSGQMQKLTGLVDEGQLTTKMSDLSRDWSVLSVSVSNSSISAAQSFEQHTKLVLRAKALLSAILHHFGLSYDSSVSSYHLIIASFEEFPLLVDALGQLRGSGAGILATQDVSGASKIQLQSLLTLFNYPYARFVSNLQEAESNDKRVKTALKDLQQLERDMQSLIRLVNDNVVNVQSYSYDSARYFADFSVVIDQLYEFNQQNVEFLKQVMQERVSEIQAERNSSVLMLAVIVLFGSVLGFLLVQSIVVTVTRLIQVAQHISSGKFDSQLDLSRQDELGQLSAALQTMSTTLKDSAEQAKSAERVKQAMDNSSSCFMMADEQLNIIYANAAVLKMLKLVEKDIKAELPHFSADNLIGKNIDQFHKNPAHQRGMLANLKSTYVSQIKVGRLHFKLTVNPINDSNGKLLGNSVEWVDRTDQVAAEINTARILESLNCTTTNVMIADASRTIIYMNKSVKDMLRAIESDIKKFLPNFAVDKILNNKMDVFHKNPAHQSALLENLQSTYETQIQLGHLYFRLVANPIFAADGTRLGSVVEWLDRTKEVEAEQEVAKIVQAAGRGDFSERVNSDNKVGFMKTISQGLNSLVDTVEAGLNDIATVLMAIAEGDLTKKIDTEYQGTFNDLKNYCNQTTENLTNTISVILEAAETINSASSEIAQGNSDLSSRTEEQASSLEETASSMEELTGTVRLNAENANQANGLASEASSVAVDGGGLIQKVVATMSSINESARKIEDIIGVIDGIAFQTNILALNAAVEAARAGEQGRGFAVVASEVRSLAQRSANAAKDIKELISDSVAKIENGNVLVNQSGETMDKVVTSIKRVNDIMAEIAAASAEQATGIDEVSKAVMQMDEVTQQNAALVEQAAAAAESLQSQAEQLFIRVTSFKVNDSGSRAKTVKALPSPKPASSAVAAKPKKVTKPEIQRKSKSAPADDDEWESF